MDARRFDDFARLLAQNTSRRRLVHLIGGSVFAGLVGAAGFSRANATNCTDRCARLPAASREKCLATCSAAEDARATAKAEANQARATAEADASQARATAEAESHEARARAEALRQCHGDASRLCGTGAHITCCAPNEKCVNGRCHGLTAEPCPPGSLMCGDINEHVCYPGGNCCGPWDCQGGQVCSDGTCCNAKDTCDPGQCGWMSDGCGGTLNCGGCDESQCEICSNNVCVSSCGHGQVCCGGSCVTCPYGTICCDGTCKIPLWVSGCHSDSDCCSGLVCCNGTCLCGESCHPCPFGQVCCDGTCKLPKGASGCHVDSDCCSGLVCCDGTCKLPAGGSGCHSNADCCSHTADGSNVCCGGTCCFTCQTCGVANTCAGSPSNIC